uniref:Uncharacterized protein n=1 Tax=Oryza glaberrima TaxID=4538 RepID=I1PAP6_ORYGL
MVDIPAHYPPNPRDNGPLPRLVEIHHAASSGAGAASPRPVARRRCRRLSPHPPAPPPPLAADVAAANASRRICTCRLTGSSGAASLCSPVPAPPPFLPRCTTSAQPSLLPTARYRLFPNKNHELGISFIDKRYTLLASTMLLIRF